MADPRRWRANICPAGDAEDTGRQPPRYVMAIPLLQILRFFRWLIILTYGIAVIASFTALGQVTYRTALWHRPFVLFLTLAAALAAWTAWGRFRSDGTSQSFLLLAAFATLAVLYAPHALLE